MAEQANMLFLNVPSGESKTIPAGFLFASISPASGATYTITNSLDGEITNVSLKTSPSIGTVFTFPSPPSTEGWTAHIIAASGGAVTIAYASGR